MPLYRLLTRSFIHGGLRDGGEIVELQEHEASAHMVLVEPKNHAEIVKPVERPPARLEGEILAAAPGEETEPPPVAEQPE